MYIYISEISTGCQFKSFIKSTINPIQLVNNHLSINYQSVLSNWQQSVINQTSIGYQLFTNRLSIVL